MLLTTLIALLAFTPAADIEWLIDNQSPIDYWPDLIQLEEAINNLEPEPIVELVIEPIVEPKIDPVACSCVKYIAQFIKLPPIHTPAELEPNATLWEAKAVLLDYKLPHIALIEKIDNRGIMIKESNFKKCAYGTRWLKFNDKHIRGFYRPS